MKPSEFFVSSEMDRALMMKYVESISAMKAYEERQNAKRTARESARNKGKKGKR